MKFLAQDHHNSNGGGGGGGGGNAAGNDIYIYINNIYYVQCTQLKNEVSDDTDEQIDKPTYNYVITEQYYSSLCYYKYIT